MTQRPIPTYAVDAAEEGLESNKAIIRRLYDELHHRHNLAIVDELLAPDVVGHWSGVPAITGRDAFRDAVAMDLAGFPDQHMTLEACIAEGDTVATAWTYRGTHTGEYYGIAPTHKAIVSSFVAIDRIRDGQVVEDWTIFDNLEIMQQLGVIPTPE